MRKYQQQQILEILDTLIEAHFTFEKIRSVGVLAECQDTVEALAEYIPNIAANYSETFNALDAYNQQLFKFSKTPNRRIDTLNQAILKVVQCVTEELVPDKIEVAFFPYQLSMWDSLESIYLAAKEDPNCDAYCVPIPWYDKLPNGEFGQMHYDGGKYPDNIEIVNWVEYDVEARHPDVIYVHNPYDEANAVSSVHPNFYTKRLRELTDCLVYVPYFVTSENATIDENFVVVPGVAYAHKVIVENEHQKETYEQIITRELPWLDITDKFVPLGSPKYDKVSNTSSEDFELPAEWNEIIGGRKVILYNTSVHAALQDSEQYLKKLRSVLATFQQRDDVVVWWRPHPLLRETFSSMRPHLLAEYDEIVRKYKANESFIEDAQQVNDN